MKWCAHVHCLVLLQGSGREIEHVSDQKQSLNTSLYARIEPTQDQQHKAMSLLSQWQDHKHMATVCQWQVTDSSSCLGQKYSERQRHSHKEPSPKLQTFNKQQQPTAYLCLALSDKRISACTLTSDNLAHQMKQNPWKTKPQIHLPFLNKVSDVPIKIIQDVCLIVHTQNHLCKTLQIIFRYSAHPLGRERLLGLQWSLQNNGTPPWKGNSTEILMHQSSLSV